MSDYKELFSQIRNTPEMEKIKAKRSKDILLEHISKYNLKRILNSKKEITYEKMFYMIKEETNKDPDCILVGVCLSMLARLRILRNK